MTNENKISIHDNFLVSYEVFCETRQIVFKTEYRDRPDQIEKTLVEFTGVNCYYFENDSVIGTVLLDIEECDPMSIYDQNLDYILKRINYGWPGDWAKSENTARDFFRTMGLKAFEISSSCGLSGWIIGKSVKFTNEICT